MSTRRCIEVVVVLGGLIIHRIGRRTLPRSRGTLPRSGMLPLLLRPLIPSRCPRVGRDALQTRQASQRLLGTSRHEALQLRALPRLILPLVLIKFTIVVARSRHWPLGCALDAPQCGLRSRLLQLGRFLLLRLGAHAGYAVDGPGDVGDGGAVAVLGFVFETDVFGVVEVCGKGARDGEELVFDHYVDVVEGEAGPHGF